MSVSRKKRKRCRECVPMAQQPRRVVAFSEIDFGK
jgi:hypothetical protein